MTTQPAQGTPPKASKPSRRGRPTLLDAEKQQTIAGLIVSGAFAVDACEQAGIGSSTFYVWLEKGKKQKRGRYRDFLEAITRAQSQRRMLLLADVRNAAKPKDGKRGEWQAAAWVLQHTDAAMFSPQLHLHVKTELTAALQRLEQEFRNEPKILERAILALTGGAGHGTPGGDPSTGSAGNDGPSAFPDPSAAVAAATRIPRP